MIKSDYKPHKPRNPIFSAGKKSAVAPIIMIAVSLGLIIWGIGSAILKDNNTIEETKSSEIALDQTVTSSEAQETNQVYEIPLNLQEEQSDITATDPKLATSNPIKKATNTWKSTRIRNGDSTARVFKRLGLSPTDLYNIMQVGKPTAILKRVQSGHQLDYSVNSDGQLVGIRYHIDKLSTLQVLKKNNKWHAETLTKTVEVRQASASGRIDSSLFLAGKNAGLSDALVMELAGIFGWDIDFILDIRKDDRFTLIYEEKYVDGDKFGNGNILAAEFVNQGKSYKAVLYTDKDGHSEYFSPEGFSMRKAFLRAPLDFSHVSSNFNPRRFHPVLKRVKAHRGIDYAAPIGTPIKAAGDGKVIRSSYDKYNGHHVFIQHGQKYTTKYLHLTKRKVKTGQRVKQGKIIGTLGRSGMVTGAHLHYEFLVNGVHRNPRTVKLPDAEPIRKRERKRFMEQSAPLLAQLDKRGSFQQIKVANAD